MKRPLNKVYMKVKKAKPVKPVPVIEPVTVEDQVEEHFQLWKTTVDWVIEVEEDWEPVESGFQRVFFYNEIQDVGETDSIPGIYKVIIRDGFIAEASVRIGEQERWVYFDV